MPIQLFRLRGVPDDEVEDIRELLSNHGIDFYETPAGNWGISMPAIWLSDQSQLQRARALIEKYQQDRLVRIKNEYEQLRKQKKNRTLIHEIKDDPIRFVFYIAIIVIVVYLSTKPFLDFGK